MQWEKLGLVHGPDGSLPWARSSALTPTPVVLEPGLVRVYAGMRDASGVSRIGWVDLREDDPTQVERVCERPALDVGRPGCFDDNGVILGDVVHHDDGLLMYYVGFQLVAGVKFLAFTGLARSDDGGTTYQRTQETPVVDRGPKGSFIRAVHTVLPEKGAWRAWVAVGDAFPVINRTPYPAYNTFSLRGTSPTRLDEQSAQPCLPLQDGEYRLGRPRVYRTPTGYRMLFTVGTLAGTYLPGHAESDDGENWVRDDTRLGLLPSAEGWDSETLCYPSLFDAGGETYAVYNGNAMGRDGFGLARLVST